MIWDIYCVCHKIAETIVGTTIMWPLSRAAFDFSWWLAGIIVGQS